MIYKYTAEWTNRHRSNLQCLVLLKLLNLRAVAVDETTVATAATGGFVTRQLVSAIQDHTHIFPFAQHMFLFVEANESGDSGEYCVVSTHFHLKKSVFRLCRIVL